MPHMQDSLMEYVANIAIIKAFGKEERKSQTRQSGQHAIM